MRFRFDDEPGGMMDAVKIQNFARNYPGQQFPWHRTLSASEAADLRRRLCMQAGITWDDDGLSLVQKLLAESRPIDDVDPNDGAFDLADPIGRANIRPNNEVYVNWYRYDQIDCLRFDDLAKYFDNLRYESEDVDIFDDSLSWVFLVLHYGQVSIVNLPLLSGPPPA